MKISQHITCLFDRHDWEIWFEVGTRWFSCDLSKWNRESVYRKAFPEMDSNIATSIDADIDHDGHLNTITVHFHKSNDRWRFFHRL